MLFKKQLDHNLWMETNPCERFKVFFDCAHTVSGAPLIAERLSLVRTRSSQSPAMVTSHLPKYLQ